MLKRVGILVSMGALGLMAIAPAAAAPVNGYTAQYNAVFTSCTLPDGTVPACEAAINIYAQAIVGAVELAEANTSFQALRGEVWAANEADAVFRRQIDALFELLLPESGSIGPAPSPTQPG